MENCNLCELCNTRFSQVQTVGNTNDQECELLIVGDYPKQDDDVNGMPFVGDKFAFLWELLNSIGVKYKVTYLLKCIPIDVRTRRYRKPNPEEYNVCMLNNFYKELEILKPKCILFFGQSTIDVVLGEGHKVADYREAAHDYRGYPFLATYHPSYVINSDNEMFYNRLIDDVVYACRHAMKHRSTGKYKTIDITPSQFERIVDIWMNDETIEYVSFDTESNGLNPLLKGAKITSFSVSVDKDMSTGYNIFMYHPEMPEITDEDRERVIQSAKRLLTQKKVIAHHAKHEHRFVKVLWGFTPNIVDDTMYMSYILYLAYPGMKHGLKYLAGRFLAMPPWEEYIDQYVDVFSRIKRRKHMTDEVANAIIEDYKYWLDLTVEDIYRFYDILKDPDYYIKQEESEDSDVFMWMIPKRVMQRYAGMDAIAPLMLSKVLKPMIEADSGLLSAYQMMMKGAEAFANMELKGLRVEGIDRWTQIYADKIEENLQKLREFPEVQEFELENNVEFNPSSTKHTQDVFFQKFKFPVKGMTGKGAPSTSETTLISLIKEYREIPGAEKHLEFLTIFRDYKKLKKLMSAYLIGLRRFIHDNDAFDGFSCKTIPVPEGNREMHIHPGYKLHTVDTGRIASADPSLHTIPAGSDIKRLLVSHWYDRGGLIVTADQSQLELRVLASIIEKYYGDSSLAQAYRDGKDIHRFNASKVFARPESDIVDSERRFAKTISFSLLYGSSEASVAESTGRTPAEVHELFETFFAAFPGIKKYIEASHEYARQYGCVRTPMGRIKHVLAAQHPEDRYKYSTALRQAQNGIIQSSGSDMSFASIVYMNDYFRDHNLNTKVVGFIHDSLELDAYPGEWFAAYDLLKYSMKGLNEERDWVTCPLGIDVEIGTSMGDTVVVKDIEVLEDGSRIFTMKGYDYIMEDILRESQYGYEIVSDEILQEEEFFNRTGDLIAKKALNLSFDNKTFNLQLRKVHWKPKEGSSDLYHRFTK